MTTESFVNFGVTRSIDLRTGARVSLSGTDGGFIDGNLLAFGQARFHLGTVYAMMLGFSVGGGAFKRSAPEVYPPVVVLLALTGVTQVMAIEEALGVTDGHRETLAFVESWIDRAEHPPSPGPA